MDSLMNQKDKGLGIMIAIPSMDQSEEEEHEGTQAVKAMFKAAGIELDDEKAKAAYDAFYIAHHECHVEEDKEEESELGHGMEHGTDEGNPY